MFNHWTNNKPKLKIKTTQNNVNISEDDLDVMHLLQNDPGLSQRVISNRLGMSLGKVNYSLKSLANVGYIKLRNFKKSDNKSSYLYILTPKGITAKIQVTKKYLSIKQKEYEKLTQYLANGKKK